MAQFLYRLYVDIYGYDIYDMKYTNQIRVEYESITKIKGRYTFLNFFLNSWSVFLFFIDVSQKLRVCLYINTFFYFFLIS